MKTGSILLNLLIAILIMSCGLLDDALDDDNSSDTEFSESLFYGEWEDENSRIYYCTDGTGYSIWDSGSTSAFEWSLSGNLLTWVFPSGNTNVGTILEANSTYHKTQSSDGTIWNAYRISGNGCYEVQTPILSTLEVTDITQTTAECGGDIISAGGSGVTARGVCWSLNSNPSLNDSYTSDGSGDGVFTSSITGLTTNTTYYVRAYAANNAGIAYGNQTSFNTSEEKVWVMQAIATPSTHSDSYDPDVTCSSWEVVGAPIRFSVCSYSSGGSGFSVVENTGSVEAEVCWTIYYNDASNSPSNGCNLGLDAGQLTSSSCSNCGTNNGGASYVEITKYEEI